ncbi:phosphate signaling complex protein PhoU [Nesterenkonia lutea]|uniref:Phosphate-specific transport system accessory protein PhoU n=1 Tax=Nesterenkonia lutea TaxID=272919 RepID=A0ABR9JBT2_9MICC|nr:phosphate signaling complex protein PhoU [Nesterenkonia lutea]MBE1523245.1 phosphate transport system protein [Nesterenkonia lutea]
MRKLFQADLINLGEQLIQITTLVHAAMEKAYTAFENIDLQLAEEVIAADVQIDRLQVELDEKAIELLALQGPVASDLRMIVGALRMSTSLERMGDLARHIAQLTRLRYPDRVAPDVLHPVFEKMSKLSTQISARLITLLETRELHLVAEIHALNEQLNDLHASVFTIVAAEDWQQSAATSVDSSLVSRFFERFGDHGVSVANKVDYLVTGAWDSREH